MSLYAPIPGSDPHRAIQHLRTLPLGHQLTSAELANAIGAGHSGFGARMDRAVIAGALEQAMTAGGWALWSLSADWWHGRQAVDPLTIETQPDGAVSLRRGRAEIVLGRGDLERLRECAA